VAAQKWLFCAEPSVRVLRLNYNILKRLARERERFTNELALVWASGETTVLR